jgi:hypothetical protein
MVQIRTLSTYHLVKIVVSTVIPHCSSLASTSRSVEEYVVVHKRCVRATHASVSCSEVCGTSHMI